MDRRAIALLGAILLACGGDDAAADTDAGPSSAGSSDPSSPGGSNSGGDAGPSEPPPPLESACEAPTPPTLGAAVDVASADELRAAVAAGGEIRLTADIDADAPFDVGADIVVDGAGFTISGGGSTHLFVSEEASVTLMNMTLRDAVNRVSDDEHFSRRSGAAVMMRGVGQGRLEIYGVTFENNEIGQTGPGDLRGGALYAFAVPDVLIVDSQFVNNRGSNGGAIGGLGSSYRIINTSFQDNVTNGPGGPGALEGRGGAISLDAVSQNEQTAYFEVCGSFFENNVAKHAGGAIAVVPHQWQDGTFIVEKSTFVNNRTTEGSGGAIYLLDDENYPMEGGANQSRIANSYFEGNETLGGGGGLWFQTGSGALQLENDTFFANRTTAPQGMGGAVALLNGPTSVTHCTFAENHAQFHGGGIQATSDARVTVTNSLFYDNTSDRDGGWAWFHANRELEDGGGNMQYLDPALEVDTNSNLPVTANATLADAALEAPADNGGPTRTMALPSGSPAIDAGVATETADDQRGEPREGTPDVGAYEAG